ncbi:MAG: 3-hydroxyacyl-CoA dehydrogenase NAD-binding domain-containing protein [Chitinophagales bacterium]|nr:3-hydroxyacyl-CoA dehydrogenase NAD-binding domain-containing protein [Chitinophagales bacterium]MDW8418029.1 3-hydroxyacyl-CoA dehydrogenase NAD-binding domain-containing protein [Chitinophagales bacterium]
MAQTATIEKRPDGVAIVWLDQPNEKVNKVSLEFIAELDNLFRQLETDDEVKAAVIASRKKDWIAGADIEMFGKVKKKGDFIQVTRNGHEALFRLERSKKPVVAAIHGACLGAGTEIALACHGRIVSDDRSTHMALPEVMLGLLPGGGGTQRLPRLIGIQKALDMMLTGKKIYASKAVKIGLADKITTRESLVDAAVAFALQLTQSPFSRKDKRTFLEKLLESNSLTRSIIYRKAKEMVLKQTMGNYPAPLKILECVETGMEQGMTAGLNAEAEKFEELILTDVSRQLIRVFFNMTEKKKNPYPSSLIKPCHTIAMVGAGFMGAGIAQVSAAEGIRVLLKDIKEETLAAAKQTIYKDYERKLRNKAITAPEVEEIIGRVESKLDYSGFEKADIIIEAVFEDIKLKQRVLAECEAAARPDAIFASNTSALQISHIAEKASRPENVIGMHYFSPVPKMPLLEIVKTPRTADWVVATCFELGVRQGKTCIVVNDGPGFYTTRILAPYMNECFLLIEEGCEAGLIDRAMKKWGFPVGPVTLQDEVGIDVGAHVMKGELAEVAKAREGYRSTDAIIKMFQDGYHGKKNKRGFYKYDERGKKQGINEDIYKYFGNPARKEFSTETIQNRLGMMMINEALYCLQEGILQNPTDGDVGAIFGLGFPPFTGGPFRYIDREGAEKILAVMEDLAIKYGARFKPAPILRDYAKAGMKFYAD